LLWTAWRTVGRNRLSRERPSVPEPGRASKPHSKSKRWSSDHHGPGQGGSPSKSTTCAHSCGFAGRRRPVRDPRTWKTSRSNSRSFKLDQKRNNVVVPRRAVVEQEYAPSAPRCWINLQEGGGQGCGQEPHRLRRIRGSGAASMDCCTSPTWPGRRQASFRSGQGWRGNRRADIEVRPRTSTGVRWASSNWRGSVADIARRYPANTRLFGKSRTSPTTAASSK